MKQIKTYSREETFLLGKELAKVAKPGEIYCLSGDLGAGKTVLTQGFAEGLGVKDVVNSPTFTIVQEYEKGRLPLYHFDVYRIEDPEEMEEIGYEEYFYGQGVCLIEWASLISDLLPKKRIDIVIEKDQKEGYDYRLITIKDRENYEDIRN